MTSQFTGIRGVTNIDSASTNYRNISLANKLRIEFQKPFYSNIRREAISSRAIKRLRNPSEKPALKRIFSRTLQEDHLENSRNTGSVRVLYLKRPD